MSGLGHTLHISPSKGHDESIQYEYLIFHFRYYKFVYSDAGRDWGQEEKGKTEDEMAGWHHWLDGRESEWTPGVGDGQGGLACCDSWGCKESDMTERLNWTELKEVLRWVMFAYFPEQLYNVTKVMWLISLFPWVINNVILIYKVRPKFHY